MLIEVKNNVIGANSKPLVQVVPSLFVFLRWFCSKLSNMGHNLHTIHSYLLTPFNPIFSFVSIKIVLLFLPSHPFPPIPFHFASHPIPTLFSFPKPHTSFHVFLLLFPSSHTSFYGTPFFLGVEMWTLIRQIECGKKKK